eukprot:8992275-Alexandrium_andersonii.AAC.1
MSASLVGSEMCIREQAASARKVEQASEGEEAEADPEGAGDEADAPEPVSYTHLTLPTICSV